MIGHLEGVDFLLRRYNGVIDVNVRNTSGLTPLMKAALQGRTRCAKRLLIAGKEKVDKINKINERFGIGRSFSNTVETVYFVGASPLLKDHIRGLTAAQWARLCGRHMCEDLINRSSVGLEEDSESPSLPYTLSEVSNTENRIFT